MKRKEVEKIKKNKSFLIINLSILLIKINCIEIYIYTWILNVYDTCYLFFLLQIIHAMIYAMIHVSKKHVYLNSSFCNL